MQTTPPPTPGRSSLEATPLPGGKSETSPSSRLEPHKWPNPSLVCCGDLISGHLTKMLPQAPPLATKQLVLDWTKAFGSHPRQLPFVHLLGAQLTCPRSPNSTQPRLPLIRPDCHTHSGRTHSLEPHTDEGAELDVHLRMCGIMCHVHGLHSPVEQLLWGQNFAIFVQPVRLTQHQARIH